LNTGTAVSLYPFKSMPRYPSCQVTAGTWG